VSLLGAIRDAISRETAPTTLGLSALASNESTLANPQPWLRDIFGGGPTASGKQVTADNAMRASAVYGCVEVLSQSVGQLPCMLMRRTKDGGAEPADDHPLFPLLGNLFNDETTSQDGFELGMRHLCLRGENYVQVVRDQAGRVVSLTPLLGQFVIMRRNALGKLVYDYTPNGGSKETFEFDEVWRTIGLTFNGIQGVSPITHARESIGLSLATEEHGAKLFANGAQVATAFEHPGVLSEEGYKRLQASIDSRFGGSSNAFKSILLEDGMKVSKLAMTSADAQYLELRRFQLEEICRIFRVPPHKVQDLARATFNNIEHLSIDFVNSSLAPWLVKFQQTGFRDLLLPNERKKLFLRFNSDSLIGGDRASRANYYASGITNRWLNPNEARIAEHKNPYPGGEKFENPNTTSSAPGDKPGETVADPQKG
jgi:HK97 family phage portal protein